VVPGDLTHARREILGAVRRALGIAEGDA
jgi:hypothetical protein